LYSLTTSDAEPSHVACAHLYIFFSEMSNFLPIFFNWLFVVVLAQTLL
jgi:hypothetical protein